MHDHGNELQVQTRMAYLSNQIEQMQWELARLSREAQVSNAGITAVRKYLLNSDAQLQIHKTSADLLAQLDTQQDEIEELSKTIKKLSRTQFKANALSESKDQQLADTLRFLQEFANKREEIKDDRQQQEQERLMAAQSSARGDVAADFLPVLDGIEMALEHRIEFPAMQSEPEESPSLDQMQEKAELSSGFLHKIFHHENKRPGSESLPVAPRASQTNQTLREWHSAMTGWLKGLEIVRDRFLTLLEYEGIERIPDVGSRFDPHRHVAVDAEERADVADGTIVSVIRKGYMQHERILRYAEVVVAKSSVKDAVTPSEKIETETEIHEQWNADISDETVSADRAGDEFDEDAEHEFATFTNNEEEYLEDEEDDQEL